MKNEIKSALQWESKFNAVSLLITDAIDIIEKISPYEVTENPRKIYNNLREAKQICDELKYYFCQNSIYKLLLGQGLSREEFYLLAAQGILLIPSTTGLEQAHEEFAYYLYEDNNQKGYIQPDQLPISEGTAQFTMGVTPEDVRKEFLRPDQIEFFEKHRPNLFSRFR